MAYDYATYRQPYRHGDYHLVDTRHQGTYWQCADGMVVRLASSEREESVAAIVPSTSMRRPVDDPAHDRHDVAQCRAAGRRRFRVLCAALPTDNAGSPPQREPESAAVSSRDGPGGRSPAGTRDEARHPERPFRR